MRAFDQVYRESIDNPEQFWGDAAEAVPNNTYGHGRIDAREMLLGDADVDGTSNLNDCAPVKSDLWATPSNSGSMQKTSLSNSASLPFCRQHHRPDCVSKIQLKKME